MAQKGKYRRERTEQSPQGPLDKRQLIHTVVDPTVRHDNHLPRCCMRMAGGLHPRTRWSCPLWRPAGGLSAGGNTPAQSPPSGRREQARAEGLALPPGPGNTCALRPTNLRLARVDTRPRESRLIY